LGVSRVLLGAIEGSSELTSYVFRMISGSLSDKFRKRKSFTLDTLVVLSTSVAYVYSVIAFLTNQGVSFFEASASVLTIDLLRN
jgi:cation transport ATPase